MLLANSFAYSLPPIACLVSNHSILVNSIDAVLAAIASVLKVLHCDLPCAYGPGGLTWQQAVAAYAVIGSSQFFNSHLSL